MPRKNKALLVKSKFNHSRAIDTKWITGLRMIFEYGDFGLNTATNDDYVAYLIRTSKIKDTDSENE